MELLQTPEQFNENLITAMGVEPVREFERNVAREDQRQKKRNSDGVPLWDVVCSMLDDGQVARFKVRMAADLKPEIVPGRIRFGGLRAPTWEDGQRNVVRFTADTFTQEDRPSLKRPERDAPPVPPAPVKAA